LLLKQAWLPEKASRLKSAELKLSVNRENLRTFGTAFSQKKLDFQKRTVKRRLSTWGHLHGTFQLCPTALDSTEDGKLKVPQKAHTLRALILSENGLLSGGPDHLFFLASLSLPVHGSLATGAKRKDADPPLVYTCTGAGSSENIES
jgi:hypothetical protein